MCLLTWEREGERNIDKLPPICAQTGDQTHDLVMYSDWELNLWPFGVQNDTPTKRSQGLADSLILRAGNSLIPFWEIWVAKEKNLSPPISKFPLWNGPAS